MTGTGKRPEIKAERKDRMERKTEKRIKTTKAIAVLLVLAVMMAAAGCKSAGNNAAGNGREGQADAQQTGNDVDTENNFADALVRTSDSPDAAAAGIAGESAVDTVVDFSMLKAENPDIFAWLYIPGTSIDCPVLQSEEADDYYESHNAYGETDQGGALYTELANLKDMCDFNTVIHGKTSADGTEGLFSDLYKFADPDFFGEHERIYLFIDGNLLTYEVFAAYERENTSLIRTYDFTYLSGCQQFLDDLYGAREMGRNLREGWDDLTPYHFLITLTTQRGEGQEKQYVVVAVLTGDAAGTIDRIMYE